MVRKVEERLKLVIELVPSTVWYSSLYRLLPRTEWSRLKRQIYAKEGRKCYICGSQQGLLSLHELWEYDDDGFTQTLTTVHHLCNLCHKIKHIGFWCHTPDGRQKLMQEGLDRDDLIAHFCLVNNCSKTMFQQHEDEAFKTWQRRSQHQWKQDFGIYQVDLSHENHV